MTPIAQLIAELRYDVADLEGSAASGRKVLTDECVDRIRRAAEALARQEELLAEAGKVVPDPDDLSAMEKIGQAALDVCLPTLKAHWRSGGSASMNPSLDYMNINMGRAVVAQIRAAARLSDKLGGK